MYLYHECCHDARAACPAPLFVSCPYRRDESLSFEPLRVPALRLTLLLGLVVICAIVAVLVASG